MEGEIHVTFSVAQHLCSNSMMRAVAQITCRASQLTRRITILSHHLPFWAATLLWFCGIVAACYCNSHMVVKKQAIYWLIQEANNVLRKLCAARWSQTCYIKPGIVIAWRLGLR